MTYLTLYMNSIYLFFAYFFKKIRKKARRLVQHHTVTHINAV